MMNTGGEHPEGVRPESGDGDRDESHDERMDRNFVELLQELRVLQTGTQILAGFLLILPFQPRFAELDDYQRALFLIAVMAAFLTTILLLAPVSMHRTLFRRRLKGELVAASHRLSRLGLLALAITMTAALMLIFSVVLGPVASASAGVVIVVLFVVLWLVLPERIGRQAGNT